MAYTPVGWQDGTGPNTYPGILTMDNGIVAAHQQLDVSHQGVDTLAALKSTSVSGLSTGALRHTNGYWAVGDGGAALYRYNSTSTATANDATVVAPNTGSGRWHLIETGNPISVNTFGAVGDGIADDSGAIQACFNWVVAGGKPRRVALLRGSTYKINSQLTLDVSYVSLQGNGATINASSMTSGAAIRLTSTGFGGTYQNTVNPLSGVKFVGPGYGNIATTIALHLDSNEDVSYQGPTHINFYDLFIADFNKGISFGDFTNMNNFYGCTINACDIGVHYPVYNTVVNSGERNTFTNCNIMQCSTWGIFASGGVLHFTSCSIDYSIRQIYVQDARAYLNNCHFEGGLYATQAPIKCEGSTAAIFFVGGNHYQNNAGPYQIDYYVESNAGDSAGVVFEACYLEAIQPTSGFFNTGVGRVVVNPETCVTNLQELAKLPSPQADRGDVSVTLSARDKRTQRYTVALTTTRTATLPTAERISGMKFRFLRESTATGASALNISNGTTTELSLAVSQWAEVAWSGTAWIVTGRGSL